MKCALFFLLLVLLRLLPWGATQSTAPTPTEAASPLPETNGSTCAQWLYGTEPPRVKAFECAGQPDGAQVKFCCGTCAQTRSCSVEELAEGAPARPADGAPEPCPPPPPPPVPHWVRLLSFCGGVLATAVFYWALSLSWGKCCRRKSSIPERPEEIELEVVSVSSPERPGSSAASTGLVPPTSAGAEGLRSPRGRPAAAPSNAPSVQPQAGDSGNVRRMWDPREPAPYRNGPVSPSQLIRGGKRFRAGSGK